MGYINLGPGVSETPTTVTPGGGQYTAEDHSFESIVFQQGKLPLDWEMNLLQDAIMANGVRRSNKRSYPSGWITNSFLSAAQPPDYSFLTADPPGATTANSFLLTAADVMVNGWPIRFEYSGTSTAGSNRITLPAPPASGVRTDLVILEVWRALVSPSPDTSNKSISGQVLRFGNAKAPDSVGNQNLLDDLLDPTYLTATSRRVQIQYRYRVIPGISNLSVTPDGFGDAAVVAHTVPYLSASNVDGATTALSYSQSTTDPGLWIAGAGNSTDATTLGTADGHIYAVPICAVFRRNSTTFNRTTNLNGGGLMATSATSSPDGIYSDQIVSSAVKDLRKSAAADLRETLDKTIHQIFDNSLVSEHEYSASGPAGTSFITKDDIGTSGHIGNPDGVRVNFSDRSVTESIVIKKTLAGVSTFNVDLSSMQPPWAGAAFNVESLAPTGTSIVGFGKVRVVTATVDYDMMVTGSPTHVTSIVMSASPGPAVDHAVFTLSGNTTGTVYVEVFVEYPSGVGTQRNIVAPLMLWTPPAANIAAWVNPASLTAVASDATREMLNTGFWWTDNSHRELSVRLESTSTTFNTFCNSLTPMVVYVPDNIHGNVQLSYTSTSGPVVYSTSNYTFNSGFTAITLTNPPVATPTPITVTYVAKRPIVPVVAAPGDSYQLFYQTRAVQSIEVPAGTQTLGLIPRCYSSNLFAVTTGSASPDDSIPFEEPGIQIPIGLSPSASYSESSLDSPSTIPIQYYDGAAGFVQIPVFKPYTPDPGNVTLYKSALDTTQDGDLRNFWPKSDNGSSSYSPSVSGLSFNEMLKHRTVYPVLMELKQDFQSIGRKGTLVLVVFSNISQYDQYNSINLSSVASSSCASVYRVPGNQMNARL